MMGFDQYHEPPNELAHETRTFARMIQSLIEEAEAIDWYEQRLDVEKDAAARRRSWRTRSRRSSSTSRWTSSSSCGAKPKWRVACQGVLFQKGDIVELGEQAEEAEDDVELTRPRTAAKCGYGVCTERLPERCPMCGGIRTGTAATDRRRGRAARCRPTWLVCSRRRDDCQGWSVSGSNR